MIDLFFPGILSALLLLTADCSRPSTDRSFPASFQKELIDLHQLEHYRAGKNSFILGLETFCHRPPALAEKGRKTLLDIKGCRSLRHIWESHGPGPSPFILEFYVDGETEPSIGGPSMRSLKQRKHANSRLFLPVVPAGTL